VKSIIDADKVPRCPFSHCPSPFVRCFGYIEGKNKNLVIESRSAKQIKLFQSYFSPEFLNMSVNTQWNVKADILCPPFLKYALSAYDPGCGSDYRRHLPW
jgi:hypothetical protein